jgi:hypothetical protein
MATKHRYNYKKSEIKMLLRWAKMPRGKEKTEALTHLMEALGRTRAAVEKAGWKYLKLAQATDGRRNRQKAIPVKRGAYKKANQPAKSTQTMAVDLPGRITRFEVQNGNIHIEMAIDNP